MSYEEQLKDPRWIEKREEILSRDMRMCQHCMSSKNLQVHHRQYIEGRMAWEYSGWYLITLCDKCHKVEHDIKYGMPGLMTESGLTIKDSVNAWIGLYQSELNKKSDA